MPQPQVLGNARYANKKLALDEVPAKIEKEGLHNRFIIACKRHQLEKPRKMLKPSRIHLFVFEYFTVLVKTF